jgi:RecB family exonuclease
VSVADVPLPAESAVSTILAAVSAAIAPESVSDRQSHELITGPLLALDSSRVRRLARALRDEARRDGGIAPSGMSLVRDLLVWGITGDDPLPAALPEALADAGAAADRDRVLAFGGALAEVRRCAESDQSPAEVLWQVWSRALPDDEGWSWPERLRRAALGGHLASGHDIDAVIALFATAERLSDRYAGVVGIRGLLSALEGQRVAAERITAGTPATPAVSVMTAHLAVGRSWPHVVVVGAQEGTWPPALGASSVLRLHEWEALIRGGGKPDTAAALRDAAAERMAQERRLFALAVSRATRSLTVAVVQSDAEHPSRFVEDLGLESVHRSGRPPRPLTLDGMVSRLRSVAQDPDSPEVLRRAAIDRLAELADARDDAGVPLVPRAAPAVWWGVADPTPGVAPVRPAERPVPLSGSGLAALQQCPLRWFLSRVVRAEGPRGQAMAIGSLVHAVAEYAVRGEVPLDPDAMLEQIDRVWPELDFEAPWQSVAERQDVAAALVRLSAYLRVADPAVAVEHGFSVTIPLRDLGIEELDDAISIRGAIDRVEIDAQGRVRLIDFKTMRHPPSAREVQEDPQLGLYQLAVRHGALGDLREDPEVAGAALVQLRAETARDPGRPKVQQQPVIDAESTWLIEGIAEAVGRVRDEEFPAIVSSACRTCPFIVACPAHARGQETLS